jgi:hypothetical protein
MSATTHHPLPTAADGTSEGAALGHPETHQEATSSPRAAPGAALVPEHQREDFLPELFGSRQFFLAELLVYDWMARTCPTYSGGHWLFYRVDSQGAGYMAPSIDSPVQVWIEGNGFVGDMSVDAAGIVVTLFTLSHLSFSARGDDQELLVSRYHALREFALAHPEARAIFAAID